MCREIMITAVIGAQWGDEGKGKIVDYLGRENILSARFNGGSNAGHWARHAGINMDFHLLPAAALHSRMMCVLGRGMAINVRKLEAEICRAREINPTLQVIVDPKAHVVDDAHIRRDEALELQRGIGSTKEGIGPCYADRVSRVGRCIGEAHPRNCITIDPYNIIMESAQRGGALICGAHGVMLDIAHGHYPYVTSSGCLPSDVGSGLGINPKKIDHTIGVVKAYSTLIGTGPMPMEMEPNASDRIREVGREYGTTTGRPRRIGWLDLPALKYANRVCGFDSLAITHMDVLNGFSSIAVVEAYFDEMVLSDAASYLDGNPALREFSGWKDIHDRNAQLFLDYIKEQTGIPISLISTGPDRDDMIDLR